MSPGRKRDETPPVELVWEAPPDHTQTGIYDATIVTVKQSPGRWARVRAYASPSPAYNAKRTLMRRTSGDEHWEVKVSQFDNGGTTMYGIWLRYRNEEQMGALQATPRKPRAKPGAKK